MIAKSKARGRPYGWLGVKNPFLPDARVTPGTFRHPASSSARAHPGWIQQMARLLRSALASQIPHAQTFLPSAIVTPLAHGSPGARDSGRLTGLHCALRFTAHGEVRIVIGHHRHAGYGSLTETAGQPASASSSDVPSTRRSCFWRSKAQCGSAAPGGFC